MFWVSFNICYFKTDVVGAELTSIINKIDVVIFRLTSVLLKTDVVNVCFYQKP